MANESSRRGFIRHVAAASAAVGGAVGVSRVSAEQALVPTLRMKSLSSYEISVIVLFVLSRSR
jgi:hypothetical protein